MAFFRLPQLLAWAVVAAIIGTIIKIIQGAIERVSSLGGMIVGTTAEIGWA